MILSDQPQLCKNYVYFSFVRTGVYILIFISVCFLACKQESKPVEPVEIDIDQLYSITLPSSMKPGYDMHNYASLQYYDPQMGIFIIGIEDAKANLGTIKRKRLKLDGYYRFVERMVFAQADSMFLLSDQQFLTEQNLVSKVGDYYALSSYANEVYELFYRISVYEDETHFYQIVIWTPYSTHCDYIDWINKITYSFKLI